LVLVASDGPVARVTLNRPPLNVLNLAVLEELDAVLDRLYGEAALKVVVVRGAGRAFSAGVDVADHTADRVGRMLPLFNRVVARVAGLEPPVVAAVHGATLGGGLELALAADVVLARDDSRLGQPEIALAAFPPYAAVVLPRLVGRQRAMDLVLSGRILPAAEAFRVGLVSRVIPAGEFEAAVEDYARLLAGWSAPVLRIAKRAVAGGLGLDEREALARAEALYLGELMSLADAREGIAAFSEKRPAVWRDA
jgi:cyclohexa-1,5-dienecarbonyl-CoA hydratase